LILPSTTSSKPTDKPKNKDDPETTLPKNEATTLLEKLEPTLCPTETETTLETTELELLSLLEADLSTN